MTDIEASTALLRRLGDGYGALLNDVRSIVRRAVSRGSGREIDARADEFFAVFDRPRRLSRRRWPSSGARSRTWPDDLEVRLRIGIHSGHPTLTMSGTSAWPSIPRPASARRPRGQIVVSAATRAAAGNPQRPASDSGASVDIAFLVFPTPRSCFRFRRRSTAQLPTTRTGRRSAPRHRPRIFRMAARIGRLLGTVSCSSRTHLNATYRYR